MTLAPERRFHRASAERQVDVLVELFRRYRRARFLYPESLSYAACSRRRAVNRRLPASKPNSCCTARPGHEDLPPYTCTHARISGGASSQYGEPSLPDPETGPYP